jgi:peptidyl-prolyl cis-trans isomerase D
MFDIVHKNKRFAQVILALIMIPFAFFGVDYYFQRGDSVQAVATVAGEPISKLEFDDLVREQQDRMRQASGGRGIDPAMFDNPEVRFALLEQLVNQRLLQQRADAERFRVTDDQMTRFIAEIPAFQDNGKFSADKYKLVLQQQNPPMSPQGFEARVRRELSLAPVSEPVAAANIVARSAAQRYLMLLEQQREVAIAAIDPLPYVKDVKVDDAGVKAYYDQNLVAFQTPEQARIEYVMLTPDALMAKSSVDDAAVRKHYDENAKNYTQAEQRDTAHILIAVKPDAPEAEKTAAGKKAETLLAQARANPAKFGELAKANSQDQGSAAQGGELGSFARGAMVKPFEDAAFAAKPGEIVGPVTSDFGYHVIKVNSATPAKVRTFDEVKGEIETELKRQRAAQEFATAADKLQNLVYEQADSLKPVSDALGIAVQATPLVTRSQVQQLALGNAKFAQALFAPEARESKRNTEAMEVGPNVLMAGRIVEYQPAAPRPFDQVKEEIRRQLVVRGASELAQKAGKEKLALLEQGKSDKDAGVTFGVPVTVLRNQMQAGFSPDAMARLFQASPKTLPTYFGALNDRGGYSIYRLLKVTDPPVSDEAKLKLASQRVGEQIGRELAGAYLATLKSKADVKVNQANLEKR